jgi:hypothetical protein
LKVGLTGNLASRTADRAALYRHLGCRSPWSNQYSPPIEDGQVPEDRLRELEVAMNDAFDTYREMCVGGCCIHRCRPPKC